MTMTYSLVGDPIQVDADPLERQTDLRLGARPDGGFVAVWTSFDSDGDREGISYRLFDADGSASTGERIANVTTTGIQSDADLAMADDGSFTLAWHSFGITSASQADIVARSFSLDGTAASDEIVVNTVTASQQQLVAVARLETGAVAAAWESFVLDGDNYGVATRIVGPNDAGDPDRVANSTTTYIDSNAEIAALATGGYVVGWEDSRLEGGGTRIGLRAQVFDQAANPIGSEILVADGSRGTQTDVNLIGLPDGGFVAVWDSAATDGDIPFGVVGQRYDASGGEVGDVFRIGGVGSSVFAIETAPLDDGGFAVAWGASGVFVNQQEVVPGGVYIRVYDEDGQPTTDEAFLTGDLRGLTTELLDIAQFPDGGLGLFWRTAQGGDGGSDLLFQRIELVDVTSTEPSDGEDELTADGTGEQIGGGPGDDLYLFDDGGDRAVERDGEGFDTIRATADVTLGSAEIERVELSGSGPFRVTGNDTATEIVGNGGSNILIGGGGGDTVTGGGGRDFFVFTVLDAPGATTITDFGSEDFLVFDDRFFGLGDAGVDVRGVSQAQVANALRSGLVDYDAGSGLLSIDPDGRGGPASAEPILILEGGGAFGAQDVLLF